ncbi:MAG: DUF3604 domain-containing protein [Pseudomonadales bacterium]
MLKYLGLVLIVIALLCAVLIFSATSLFDKMTETPEWIPAPGAAVESKTVQRTQRRCTDYNPLGSAWFGDLHIHTAYSMDARSRDMLGTPEMAYRFARGEPSGLGPFDEEGQPSRPRTLSHALDFAAVTDHAEWIGEINMCTKPGSIAYDTQDCRAYRGEPGVQFTGIRGVIGKFIPMRMIGLRGFAGRKPEVCGEDSSWCRDSLEDAWQTTQQATNAANDTSENCEFTAFHGWEFSDGPGMSKVHRNVIFRNNAVPELPISAFETPGPLRLWNKLDELCTNTGTGCEAVTIPHNSNVSNGRMFTVATGDLNLAQERELAIQRARFEPIVEMMQIKGESECKSGMWGVFGEDEQCGFEKIRGLDETRPEDCRNEIGSGAIMGMGCQSRLDFSRYALIEGMREEQRLGVNPYQFGLVGGTDNHNAAPGDVSETDYEGCCANTDTTADKRLSEKRGFAGKGPVARNPGGLMGVWAPQNTRDELFDAMQRREVFATSGPRIQPRFFAGWQLSEDICSGDVAASAQGASVPMGGSLNAAEQTVSPLFVATALADPNSAPSASKGLQRLQIIKLWHDEQGNFHQQVNDVAGSKSNGAGVDLGTCETHAPANTGAQNSFCATWRDPEFSNGQSAAYYVRVLENPSCRWSWHHCLSQPESERSAACSNPGVRKVIQERAWSSPIWLSGSGTAEVM